MLFMFMNDIALQDLDISKLEMLGLYELRNFGRAIGVPRPTTYGRSELIAAIKNHLKSGDTGKLKSATRGRKPRESSFDMTKLVTAEASYFLSVLDDDADLYRLRSGEVGTEKRSVGGYVHLLPKGGALVVGTDLNGYSLPVKMLFEHKLAMGDYIEGQAVFSESRQMFVISEVDSNNSGERFDNMAGVRSSAPLRVLVTTPKGFDRIEDIAKSFDKEKHNIAFLSDETDDSARHLLQSGAKEVYLAKVNFNLKKQILSCLLCLFRAKQAAEQGKNVVLYVDSFTKLFRLYNNSAYPEGKIVPGEVALGPLTDLKTYFLSGRALKNGGSLTVVAYVNKPENPVEEYVYNEFCDLAGEIIAK